MNYRYILVALMTLMTACVKDEKCSEKNNATIKTSSPVATGEALTLSVSGVDKAYIYIWHYPNGTISHDKNPVINGAGSDFAGVYTVDVVTTGGCVYSTSSDSVIIENPVAACNVPDNTFQLKGSVSTTLTVSSFSTGPTYIIEGSGSNGSVSLEFTGSKINSGKYRVLSYGDDRTPGTVNVLRISGANILWDTSPGNEILVSMANGKATVTFCDLDLVDSGFGLKTTGSLRMTEP